MQHIPVLLKEVIEQLDPKNSDKFIDATFGYGGHSEAILQHADCTVLAIDRDPAVIERADQFKIKYKDRFDFKNGNFSNILIDLPKQFNKILFDFGVSSMQLDQSERGFSFSKSAKLDMRMSQTGISAFEVINNYSQENLAEIIWKYGDESKARRIAEQIVLRRKTKPIVTTTELHDIVTATVGNYKRHSNIDVATKTFQAIRIFVNDELREIATALDNLHSTLVDNALIATISFHSLEDRIVKNWARSNKNIVAINNKVITASDSELKNNPRARSAKLRVYKLVNE